MTSQNSIQSIRKFLASAAVIYGREVTKPLIEVWLARFKDVDGEKLNSAFSYCLDHCKFFPTFADVLEVIQKTEITSVNLEGEAQWQKLLKALQWSKRPKFSEKVMRCALAAGGLEHIESCSHQDLDWARRRFAEAWEMLSRSETDPLYLPPGEAREILERIRSGMPALPTIAEICS